MRRCTLMILALAVCAALASCGDADLSAAPGQPGGTDPPPPSAVAPPNPPPQPPAVGYSFRRDLVDLQPLRPASILADPANNSRLVISFTTGSSSCFGAQLDIVESPSEVKVRLRSGGLPDSKAKACIALAELHKASVALDAPLGTRAIRIE